MPVEKREARKGRRVGPFQKLAAFFPSHPSHASPLSLPPIPSTDTGQVFRPQLHGKKCISPPQTDLPGSFSQALATLRQRLRAVRPGLGLVRGGQKRASQDLGSEVHTSPSPHRAMCASLGESHEVNSSFLDLGYRDPGPRGHRSPHSAVART